MPPESLEGRAYRKEHSRARTEAASEAAEAVDLSQRILCDLRAGKSPVADGRRLAQTVTMLLQRLAELDTLKNIEPLIKE